jgi:hypothetical protein
MVDNQLPPPFEEIPESRLTIRAGEHILLFHPYHRKPAPLGIYAVILPGKFLLLRQKFFPLGEPLFLRNHWRMRKRACHLSSPLLETNFAVALMGPLDSKHAKHHFAT